MNKTFTQHGKVERQKMANLLASKNVKYIEYTSEEGYHQFDGVYFNSKKKIVMFEVKNRNVTSTQYSTTIIEKSKYDYLLDESALKGVIPLLFVFFTDNKYAIINLNNEQAVNGQLNCPKNTASDGNNSYITKDVVEFKLTKENIYTYEY